jgi:hypothetical protein
MLDSGGLMPLATGAEVRIADGKHSVVDPFVEAKEVIGGYAIFELPGKEEALASGVHATPQGSDAGLGRHLRDSRLCPGHVLSQTPATNGRRS